MAWGAAAPYKPAPTGYPTVARSWAQPTTSGGSPAVASPSAVSQPWAPPPIPPGYYNPIRDIEGAEGQRGSEQALTGYSRNRTDAENTYGTNLGLLKQKEQQAEAANHETLARLAESYKRLGARQGDQANATGTLYGGAVISSGLKRAANEGVAKNADEVAYRNQQQAFEDQRGQLATAQSQLLGPGGSLTEAMQNARVNQQAFADSLKTLEGNEAAANGYNAPTAPRPAVAAPRVVSSRPQPSSGGRVIAKGKGKRR